MTTATQLGPRPGPSQATATRPVADLTAGALLVMALSAATCWLLGLPASLVWQTAVLYAGLALLVWRRLPDSSPGAGIGPANRITLLRAGLVLPLLVMAFMAGTLSARGYWWVGALAAVVLVLDALDGRVARRTGSGSAFGARFDMEVDALLLLALSGLLWGSGKTGAWVLLIGLLRYLFVVAGLAWPALRGELPPSLRRKVVCAAQGVVLLVCVAPVTSHRWAAPFAALALALLAYSFLVDIAWLMRNGPRGVQAQA